MNASDELPTVPASAKAAALASTDTPCPVHDPAVERRGDAGLVHRHRAVQRVFWITLALNLLVAGAKGAYSLVSGSVTLGADAFHSLLDGAANVLALIGMHFSAVPADRGHPYGHRKFEILAALGIGVLIAFGLLEVAGAAWHGLMGQRPPPDVGWPGYLIVAGAMVVNFMVARYEGRKGRELESPLLSADARHTKSDLYALGAVLLSFLGAWAGLWWVDGVCGLVLIVMVGHVAWSVFRENVPSLLDAAVLDPMRVRAIGAAIDGVESIHGVRSRGPKWAVELDLHMQVAGDMKVEDAHRIAHRVEDDLRARLPELSDVVVHIEPSPRPESWRCEAGASTKQP